MFISIKNGQITKKNSVVGPRKNICESVLKVLWNEGFILSYQVSSTNNRNIKIFLKYAKNKTPAINSINFVSKPGNRIYYSAKQVWKLDSSKIFIIFSTSNGLKSINECKKDKIGGEPLVVIS